jgi:hypothetical protein
MRYVTSTLILISLIFTIVACSSDEPEFSPGEASTIVWQEILDSKNDFIAYMSIPESRVTYHFNTQIWANTMACATYTWAHWANGEGIDEFDKDEYDKTPFSEEYMGNSIWKVTSANKRHSWHVFEYSKTIMPVDKDGNLKYSCGFLDATKENHNKLLKK